MTHPVYTDLAKTLHMPTKYVLGIIPTPIKDAASIQKNIFLPSAEVCIQERQKMKKKRSVQLPL